MESFFERPPKRHLQHVNLVPIIDMFTSVIFFLILSTTFVQITRLTLPPAHVNVSASNDEVVPLNPKLTLISNGSSLELVLRWEGSEPGELREAISTSPQAEFVLAELSKKSEKLVSNLFQKYPKEKNIRLSLLPELSYQYLIAVMDGARSVTSEVILISYEELHP